jgi:hypothetical protein
MTALKDKIQHQLNIGFHLNEIYSSLGEEGFETSEIDNAINEISVDMRELKALNVVCYFIRTSL